MASRQALRTLTGMQFYGHVENSEKYMQLGLVWQKTSLTMARQLSDLDLARFVIPHQLITLAIFLAISNHSQSLKLGVSHRNNCMSLLSQICQHSAVPIYFACDLVKKGFW